MQSGPAFALAWILGAAASAQQASSTSQAIPKPAELSPPVRGIPFSAERRQVRSRALADGTRLTETWPVYKTYRSSSGRTRTERPLLTFANAPDFPRVVEIDDPNNGTEYILEPQRKLAHRFTLISISAGSPDSATAESLGAWVMQGFRAEGLRRTMTTPAGPIVTETWTAPDLHLVVRRKLIDPRSGESTDELTRIRTGEQDPSLFKVPLDYNVVDEPGDFSIPVTVRSRASIPTIVSQVPAVYTEEAKRSGIQGIVRLTLFVDESGQAQNVHVERSLDPGLDQEAVKAVRGWRFQPGEQDGHAVRVPVHVEIAFSLNN